MERKYLISGNDSKIHRLYSLSRSLERLALLVGRIIEALGILCSNGSLGVAESLPGTSGRRSCCIKRETLAEAACAEVGICNLVRRNETKGCSRAS